MTDDKCPTANPLTIMIISVLRVRSTLQGSFGVHSAAHAALAPYQSVVRIANSTESNGLGAARACECLPFLSKSLHHLGTMPVFDQIQANLLCETSG